MWYNIFLFKTNFWLYMDCILIILFILFSSEKSVIDMFAEKYGNYVIPKSEIYLNFLILFLVVMLFLHSYVNLKINFL
ncbi:putative membrane protein [Candidatus Phytoplasma oryzae]|uniref:Putative membrane protein n=1 Tax=Candidatus Phytoplasma oryzae TaxID=203274 RepID=A0A139JQT7_9MOLU|nr:hypothetical protein [Candidatus Phytoplasma oryzae]KXT29332.1 putative membrane protein [Candidatus Phytoplasma oryzae]RAM57886.1 hypothetical protein DH96_01035 [Candidatus Phytoplasma oryzae]